MELFASEIKIPFGGSMTLKFFNPLFYDIGANSLPVSFNNKIPVVSKAFGWPHKEEVAGVGQQIAGRIKTKFLDLIGGWGINEASNDVISAYFKPSSGDFNSMIKDVRLRELDFGGVKYPAGFYENGDPKAYLDILTHMNSKMDVSYPDSEYAAFCSYMPNADTDNGTVNIKFINPVDFDESGDPEFINPQDLNNSLYLFVGTVIDYLFANYGYRIEKNIFREDVNLKCLVIFNTFNICAPLSSLYFDQARFDYKDLLPDITCGEFLKAVRDRFNIGFFINEQRRSVKIVSFDSMISGYGQQASGDRQIKGKTVDNNRIDGINFLQMGPDEWCKHKFLSAEDELEDPIIVMTYRDILPATRQPGDLILVQSEPGYYRIKFTAPSTYEAVRLCPDQFPYKEGNGEMEMTQLSGIPAMTTLEGETQYYLVGEDPASAEIDYLLPRCDLVGNGYGRPFTEFPLMFLFTRGIADCNVIPTAGDPVYKYPLGTSDVYDATGNKISSANLALKWGGAYGLVQEYWANRLSWEQNIKKLIKTELLSDDIARLIDMGEVKPIGKSNYLVNSFEIEMTNKQERLRNVELLRL